MPEITTEQNAVDRMELAQLIFDRAGEAIFVSDLEGNLLDVNQEACRLSQYSREELLKLRNVDIVVADEKPRIAVELERCDNGETVENRWLLRCKDGSTVPLDLVVQRLPGDRYLALGRDLTERERTLIELAQARDKAEEISQSKSRFLAAASHDLRQPIQAIELFHSVLMRTGLSAEQQHLAERMQQSVRSLSSILSALLDVSRLDLGAVTPTFAEVSAHDLFTQIDRRFAGQAREKGLRFKLFFPLSDVWLRTDCRLLISMLGNLIDNAIKYTERGSILVSLRRRGPDALIQVWDTGIGIPHDCLKSIYDEYFQVGNPERDSNKGLGLGLSIVKRLATLLGTKIVVRSVPAQGTVFEARLPIAEKSAPERGAPEELLTRHRSPSHDSKRAVIVEDNALVAEGLAASLTSYGFEVKRFPSAEDALNDPCTVDAHHVVTDFHLPGMNGLAFLNTLQERTRQPIAGVIVTGDTSTDCATWSKSVGWPVLTKPVSIQQLLEKLQP